MFILSGCITKYVYVEAQCPHIEVLQVVDALQGPRELDGSISAEYALPLLQGCSNLRTSETYYFNEISAYNAEYNTTE